jgi:hypothetical protein
MHQLRWRADDRSRSLGEVAAGRGVCLSNVGVLNAERSPRSRADDGPRADWAFVVRQLCLRRLILLALGDACDAWGPAGRSR